MNADNSIQNEIIWWILLLVCLSFFLPIEYYKSVPYTEILNWNEYGDMQIYSFFPLIIFDKFQYIFFYLNPLGFTARLIGSFDSYWFDLNLYIEIYCIYILFAKQVYRYHIILLFLSFLELALYYGDAHIFQHFAFSSDYYFETVIYQRGLGYYFFLMSQMMTLVGLFLKNKYPGD